MTTKLLCGLALIALVGAAWLELKVRNPCCGRCGARSLKKSMFNDWSCGRCGAKTNPLDGEVTLTLAD